MIERLIRKKRNTMQNGKQLEDAKTFGYTREWFELGLLDEAEFIAQKEKQRDQASTDFEHYRFETLMRWVRNRSSATDNEIVGIIGIVEKDSDITMSSSALLYLMDAGWLTDNQFILVTHSKLTQEEWYQKRVARASIIRSIDSGNISEEILNASVESKDKSVQKRLLSSAEIPDNAIHRLSELGASKEIRHLAKLELDRRSKLGRNG